MPDCRMPVDGAFLASLETLDYSLRTVLHGRFGGTRRAAAYGTSVEFADYREYAPGDDIRRIDWNLYGRLDKHYIRQYIDERQTETKIYLDMSASMRNKADTVLRVAAAIAYLSVCNMDRASFRLMENHACRELCGSFAGREGFYEAAEQLSDLRFAGNADIESAVLGDPAPGFGDGLSVIISDFLTGSDWRTAIDYLLARKRGAALICILSPEETRPDDDGPSRLIDEETIADGALDLLLDRDAMRAYGAALKAYRRELRDYAASRDIPLMEISTDEDLTSAILSKGFTSGLIR